MFTKKYFKRKNYNTRKPKNYSDLSACWGENGFLRLKQHLRLLIQDQPTWALAKYTRLCLGFRFLCNRLSWNSVSTKDERKAAEWRPWKGKERDSSFPKFDFYETSLRNWLVSKMLMPILLLLHFNKYLLYKLSINIGAVSSHMQIQHPSTHVPIHRHPPHTHQHQEEQYLVCMLK